MDFIDFRARVRTLRARYCGGYALSAAAVAIALLRCYGMNHHGLVLKYHNGVGVSTATPQRFATNRIQNLIHSKPTTNIYIYIILKRYSIVYSTVGERGRRTPSSERIVRVRRGGVTPGGRDED